VTPTTAFDASHIAIAASVGGTKVAFGGVNRAGHVVVARPALPTPDDEEAVISLMVEETRAIADSVGRASVYGVGVSYPECVPPPRSVAADAPHAPHPLVARITAALRGGLGADMRVAVLHDAAAAVLGEVGSHGTAPGACDATFIVWGTGMASGVVRRGALYWDDPVVGRMVSEAGGLVVRAADGRYEFRPSDDWPRLAPGEQSVDRRLCGPALARRARGVNANWGAACTADRPVLAAVNAAARSGDAEAREFFMGAGRECGHAIAAFIHYWKYDRREAFAGRIVVGSGVTRMGDGLQTGGRPALQEELRNGVAEGLGDRGVTDYDRQAVVVSTLGYEREFMAFTPPWSGKKSGSGTGNRTPV
jgi:predicted NBD/HSP70 family sugar kinase